MEERLEDLELKLREICRNRAVNYELSFSEADNTFHARTHGPGLRDSYEVKRQISPVEALRALIRKLEQNG